MFTSIIKLIRPKQWIKNLVCFAGIIFSRKFLSETNDQMLNMTAILESFSIFAAFCLVSSSIYVFNDICDRNEDRKHPEKKNRPIASGKISVPVAMIFFLILLSGSIVLGYKINLNSLKIIITYGGLMIAYSLFLKQVIIADVMIIGIGFAFRAVAGATAINVNISPWLVLCSFLLATFLGFGKRRHEMFIAEKNNNENGKIPKYDMAFLEEMSAVMAACTVMCYALYTMSPRTTKAFGDMLILTLPLVVFGIFRFLHSIHFAKQGNPSEIFYKDKVLLINVILWIIMVVYIAYSRNTSGFLDAAF